FLDNTLKDPPPTTFRSWCAKLGLSLSVNQGTYYPPQMNDPWVILPPHYQPPTCSPHQVTYRRLGGVLHWGSFDKKFFNCRFGSARTRSLKDLSC
ncbi:hypothetical protein HAX54_044508, partial [Datura stramonium]|nr:hypothetical protein [Datura stramonium]